MVESTLFFILGFLTASFLALLVSPALWRRAVTLTRRRIEASMPLSLNEMQAETDRARAEGAMVIRRLEIDVKSLKEKLATQLIELSRLRDDFRLIDSHAIAQGSVLSGLEGRVPELEDAVRQRDERIAALSERLAAAEAEAAARATEFDALDKALEDQSFASSSRQIELANRDSEIERLTTDVRRLRSEHKDGERRLTETMAQKETIEEQLTVERMHTNDLRKRLDAALRAPAEAVAASASPTEPPDVEALSAASEASGGTEGDARLLRLTAERERLESRLMTLTRENKRLRAAKQSALEGSAEPDERRDADALLREQIQRLAAEVVSLTARLEGPDSPIVKALNKPSFGGPAADGADDAESLADRVRALQKATKAP